MAAMTILLDSIVRIVSNLNTVIISNIRVFLNFIYHCYLQPLNQHDKIPMEYEALQIDGEYVLHDVIDIVCTYADTKTLNNMTQVCKSWRFAALREKKGRLHSIEQWNGSLHRLSDLPSEIKAIPFVSLLIYEGLGDNSVRAPQRNLIMDNCVREAEHIILTKYKEQLSNKAIALRVDKYDFTMEKRKFPYTKKLHQNQGGLTRDRDIMGLFFPSMDPRVRFHAASIMDGMLIEDRDVAVNRLTEELGFNDSSCNNSKSTILMFSIFNSNLFIRTVIDKLMIRQAKKGKEITFAGFYGTKIMVTDDSRSCICCGELRILLRISGSCTESWSTFIRYDAEDGEINRKLSALKKRVKSKSHYIGLVYAPRCEIRECYRHFGHRCGNSIELMKNIRCTFPYIRFTGLFVNTTFENPSEEIKFCGKLNGSSAEKQGSCMHVSIIIISHD